MDPLRPTSPESTGPSAEQPQVPGSPWARPDAAPTDADTTAAVPTVPVGQPQMAPGVAAAAAPVASAAAIAPPARRRSSGRWLNVVLAVAACVAIGGVAFAIGRGTASASTASTNNRGGFIANGNGNGTGQRPFGSFAPGANGGGFIRGGFGGGGGITLSGTVESVTADSITIKTANGQTVTIGTGVDTTYHSQAPASASDVAAGKTVEIQLGFNGARGNGSNGGANGGGSAPQASGAPAGPVGTAGSITVVP
jgi:hypothetical protein